MILINNKIEPFVSSWGVECEPTQHKLGWLLPDGWEKELISRGIDFQPFDLQDYRQELINQLQMATRTFADLIEDSAQKAEFITLINSFFFDNSNVFFQYIKSEDEQLIILFETSDAAWLDLTLNEETPTPREYALKLLSS
jgi:hypothetical protein